jgi:Holliday junction resolvase RusA-like endonuclease
MFDSAFFAFGLPKGQPRPRAFSRGGRASVYDPGTADEWKLAVALAARPKQPLNPLDGPIGIALIFYLPRPQRLLSKNAPAPRIAHVSKPDIDNLCKAVLDALTDDQWFGDDSQIARLDAQKFYASKDGASGVAVRIVQLDLDGNAPALN